MNKYVKRVLTFTLPFLPLGGAIALAGASSGGGGNAVVCFQSLADRNKVEKAIRENQCKKTGTDPFNGIDFNTVTAEMLDVYQARQQGVDNPSNQLIEPKGSVEETIQSRMSILKEKTTFHDVLLSVLEKELPFKQWNASNSGVIEVDDSKHSITFDEKCLLVQVAIQDGISVYYDQRLVSKMSTLDKTGLLLHESIYFLARQAGATDSKNSRYFVDLLLSKNLEDLTGAEINDKLMKLNLIKPDIRIEGNLPRKINEQQSVDLNCAVNWVNSYNGEGDHLNTLKDCIDSLENWGSGNSRKLWKDSWLDGMLFDKEGVVFYERHQSWGHVKSGTLVNGTVINGLAIAKGYVGFYESGRLEFGTLANDTIVNGWQLPQGTLVSFYESQKVKGIGSAPLWLTIDNIACDLRKPHKGLTRFYESGRLKSCGLLHDIVYQGIPITDFITLNENGSIYESQLSEDFKFPVHESFWNFKCKKGLWFFLDEEGYLSRCEGLYERRQ